MPRSTAKKAKTRYATKAPDVSQPMQGHCVDVGDDTSIYRDDARLTRSVRLRATPRKASDESKARQYDYHAAGERERARKQALAFAVAAHGIHQHELALHMSITAEEHGRYQFLCVTCNTWIIVTEDLNALGESYVQNGHATQAWAIVVSDNKDEA